MDSITLDWFWVWFGLLVLVALVVVILRALAASSFGVRTCRDHHNMLNSINLTNSSKLWVLLINAKAPKCTK